MARARVTAARLAGFHRTGRFAPAQGNQNRTRIGATFMKPGISLDATIGTEVAVLTDRIEIAAVHDRGISAQGTTQSNWKKT
jgi:hypothetical protein